MASTTTEQTPVGSATGYSKTSRRQYQSCDQCRKSRRACDAATLRVTNFPLGADEISEPSKASTDACSNCAKAGKKCTFEWLRTLNKQSLPKGVKRKLGLTGLSNPTTAEHEPTSLDPGYRSHHQTSATSGELTQIPVFQSSSDIEQNAPNVLLEQRRSQYIGHAANQTTLTESPKLKYEGLQTNGHADFQSASYTGQERSGQPFAIGDVKLNGHTTAPSLTRYNTASSSSSFESVSRQASSRVLPYQSITSVASDSDPDNSHPRHPPHKVARQESHSAHNAYAASFDESSSRTSFTRRSSSRALSSTGRRQSSVPLSPRQIRFADNAMKSMIATGLLRIYHDSFENSLSCWVTEKNCPYETELLDLIQQASPSSGAEEAAFRLCDNRIFSRVSRLDSAFSPLRGRSLTTYENRAASQALNAAIMAFASQWSHSSHNAFWKSKEGKSQIKAWQEHPRSGLPPNARVEDPVLSGECERMIQRTLWNEARTAIQASAEIDSFKVILAYMIFALTQRPVDQKLKQEAGSHKAKRESWTSNNTRRGSSETTFTETTSAQFTDPAMDGAMDEEWNPFYASDLEALNSPPIYLETAVRNLFSWRRKVERYRRMRSKAKDADSPAPFGALALKDQQTFNIIFWLGVMCDTTSSAISKRPLVIPDEDCAMIHEKMDQLTVNDGGGYGWSPNDHADHQEENQPGALWGSYLLDFKWAGPRDTPPRWPCSFEAAALVLQEAIPVKVLMFRKVGQLQTLSYRRSAPRKLEKCIEEALAVYQQWNQTYSQFMIDCVTAHNDLPPHVQSWYVILDGHWHYGCLLLADAIASVDKEEKTMKPQRDLRASCGLIVELRKENALAIAKIAQASLSEHAPSFPDNPEFHFACNGSAILTEPWTDILVRAMGSACKIFINWLSTWDNPGDPIHNWVVNNTIYNDLYVLAETCIHGMTLLGRKSDAANFTASIFSERLDRVCAKPPHEAPTQRSLAADLVASRPELQYLNGANPLLTAI